MFDACTSKDNKGNKNLFSDMVTPDSNYVKHDFDSSVTIIDSAMGESWDRNDKLMLIPRFREIYRYSHFYLSDAIKYLSDKKITYRQAAICLYAMQNLEIEDYLKISNTFLILYNKKEISEYLLACVIDPNFLDDKIIVKNYDNLDVINFLKEIRDKDSVSKGFRQEIDNVLAGKFK